LTSLYFYGIRGEIGGMNMRTEEILNALDDLEKSHQEARRVVKNKLIKLYKTLKAELDDYHNAEKFAVDSPCDEVHCGCVPLLIKANRQLEAENKRLREDLKRALKDVEMFENLANAIDDEKP